MEEVRYGPARVSFSGNEAAARAHLPRALKLLRQTQERARLGGLSVLGNQWALDDDSYCYAVLAGGIAAVHIVAGYADEVEAPAVVPVDIPDFVSGVIQNGHILDVPATMTTPGYKTLEKFHPTQRCADDYKLPHAYQAMQRLAVEPWTAFDELRNNSPSGQPVYSQYTKLKPTMYSGTMRQVVQALMGFGRQRRKGKKEFSRYDRKRGGSVPQAKPGKHQKDVTKDGLQIRYDWRFSRTHGITRAGDGRLWLVEIGINAGVLAMPLPLHEATTTPAFRERMEKAGDEDAMALLDALGGFPTGEAFPPAAEREAWIRAGKVLHLAEPSALTPFYQCSAYSSAMGWAFNAKGSEAHNTAYFYGDDGYMRGIHDAVNLSIGATVKVAPARQAGVLKERLAKLRGKKDYADRIEAVIWKVDRMSELQVKSALWWEDAAHAFDEVDALELAPLASGRASRTRIGNGYLYGDKYGNLIKFPEPAIDLLVSVDMQQERGHPSKVVRCNTVVHVFFSGNDLKWVRYFTDDRPSPPPRADDDFEPCMYVGAWSRHEDSGGGKLMSRFYTSDFDHREEVLPATTDITVVGKDLGYCQAQVNDCLHYPLHATFSRAKRFLRTTETKDTRGRRIESGVAVPFHDREAYYYAFHELSGTRSTAVRHAYHYLGDPWSYRTYRVVEGWAPANWPHPDGCGRGLTHHTVMDPLRFAATCGVVDPSTVEGAAVYTPGGCSDYADSGPWSGLCFDALMGSYYIPEPPVRDTTDAPPQTGAYDVWLVNSSAGGTQKTTRVEDDFYFGLWPLRSPFDGDEYSADQRIETTHNTLGSADSLRYQINLNDESRVIGVPKWPEMKSGALTYIGVIDGG